MDEMTDQEAFELLARIIATIRGTDITPEIRRIARGAVVQRARTREG